MKPKIWITWENQRRTNELAKSLDAELFIIDSEDRQGLRHLSNAVKTISLIRKYKDHIIIVQNPSRILAALAALLKLAWGFPLVVDRHTNFRIGKSISFDPRIWFVILCSEFSIRVADLTIVTNRYLKEIVESKGGKGFVLPDKVPSLDFQRREKCGNEVFNKKVIFICTYADDEPYEQVVEAARYLRDDIEIYITGNYRKQKKVLPENSPDNVIFTGFIPDIDYEHLLAEADVVIDFTSLEWCLICGGYEAMALSKPFITSNTVALQEFYEDAAVYSDHSPRSIADAIEKALGRVEVYTSRISVLRERKQFEWEADFTRLTSLLACL